MKKEFSTKKKVYLSGAISSLPYEEARKILIKRKLI